MFLRLKLKVGDEDYSVEPDDVPERMDQLQDALKEATALLVSMAKFLDTITDRLDYLEDEVQELKRRVDSTPSKERAGPGNTH